MTNGALTSTTVVLVETPNVNDHINLRIAHFCNYYDSYLKI